MKFTETPLAGAWIIDLEPHRDERGYFARTFCEKEFAAHGLPTHWPQCNTSFNLKRGTLRGLHGVKEGYEEAKLVRCTRGAIYDVIVDNRNGSTSRYCWFGTELSASNGRTLFVPNGFLHGFQALVDESEVSYMMSSAYVSDAACGVRFDDPLVGVTWPIPEVVLSLQDGTRPNLGPSTPADRGLRKRRH